MPTLASDCFFTAKGRLNDLTGALYTDTNLLPYLQDAYEELQNELAAIDAEVLEERSAIIVVPALTTSLGPDGANLQPSDMVTPITLYERAPGTVDAFVLMAETRWESFELPSSSLKKWTWREEEIKLLGSTIPREVRIDYIKSLTVISGANSAIKVSGSKLFLGTRCAALAAESIGENKTRADALHLRADEHLGKLLSRAVRRQQALPVRRRVNRYRVR